MEKVGNEGISRPLSSANGVFCVHLHVLDAGRGGGGRSISLGSSLSLAGDRPGQEPSGASADEAESASD